MAVDGNACEDALQVANKLGETIYKGHRSYDLMLNLQLGIRHSSQQVAKEPPLKQLADIHFQQKVCTAFTRICMPAHPKVNIVHACIDLMHVPQPHRSW